MQFMLILALIISIIAIIFAVSNTEQATVNFLGWTMYDGSLALSLIIAMLLGVLVSILASSPAWVKNRLAIRNLNKQLTQLQKEYADQTIKLESTEKALAEVEKQLEEIRQPPAPEQVIIPSAPESAEQPEAPAPPKPE